MDCRHTIDVLPPCLDNGLQNKIEMSATSGTKKFDPGKAFQLLDFPDIWIWTLGVRLISWNMT